MYTGVNQVTHQIIGLAIKIHRILGPGLLESVYQAALAYELNQAGLRFDKEKSLPAIYEGIKLDVGLRCDFLIEESVIVECKSVRSLHPIDQAQLLSYLRVARLPVGLLVNFNVLVLKDGIKRVVNDYKECK
ncbi:MAG: GxxExxY protein [Calditrichaeota bacterium]|nr:GxxExxY protein [Calditrichota bacterium]MCB0296449.1 GxxExxY protein [Calditrichota bacterium]MCB0304643.1 GxxExxY protein [Calditrichota bacterium]MCB9087925.1 GxxExxY protein [Calditrichia bacterium]